MGGNAEEAVGGNRRLDSPGNTGWDVATETKFLRSAAVRPIVGVSSASFGPNNLPKENFT